MNLNKHVLHFKCIVFYDSELYLVDIFLIHVFCESFIPWPCMFIKVTSVINVTNIGINKKPFM